MLSTITKSIKQLNSHAGIILALCGAASLLLYTRFIQFNLNTYAEKPLLSLQLLLHNDKGTALSLMAVMLGLATLYGVGYWSVLRLSQRTAWFLVIGWAAGFAVVLLFMYPFAAADIWDYILHARIFGVYGDNPYVDLVKQYPADPFYEYAFWKDLASTYGPAWVLVTGLVARLAGDGITANVITFKLVPGVFFFASLGVITLILRRTTPVRLLPAVFLLAWNPMVLFETFGNGHNDMSMVFWILLAALYLIKKQYVLTILSLIVGALFKFIPLMLLPAAGLICLRDIDGLKARLRFLIVSGLLSAGLLAAVYAPFWHGWETLTVLGRSDLFRSSLAAILYTGLGKTIDKATLSQVLVLLVNSLLLVYIAWASWRAFKDKTWLSFPTAAVRILLFYLLVSCTWMMVWYPIWPLALAVLLPPGALQGLAVFFSLTVLTKQFLLFPVFWWGKKLTNFQVDLSLFLLLVLPSWLYVLAFYGNSIVRKTTTSLQKKRSP